MNSNNILVRLQPSASSGDISKLTLTPIVSQFGPVAAIKVLQRHPELYFLVEFHQAQSCLDALEFLDGMIENLGWITSFPAENLSQYPWAKSLPHGHDMNSNMLTSRCDDITGGIKISVPFRLISYSNNNSSNSSANEKLVVCSRSSESENQSLSLNCSSTENRCRKEISVLKTEIDITRECPDNSVRLVTQPRDIQNLPSLDMTTMIEKSCFVQIHNLNPKLLNERVIINLACCFGNALRVYINSPVGLAIIRYRNSKDADRATFYLQDQTFFGSKLKLVNVMPESINPISLAPKEPSLQVFECKPPDFRYKNSLKVKFNAPSPVLHLTNLSENCTPQILFQILQSIHEPCRIFKLAKKSINSTNMVLVEFRSIEESREVLTILHNKIIDHKSIRVSFSHAKLD
jgi:hypothetical protein